MDKRVLLYMVFLTLSFYVVLRFFSPKPSTIQNVVPQEMAIDHESSSEKEMEEQLYVLENNYQQIVFSNIGGSIAEINLLLKSKNNDSIILPIEIDNIIDNDYQENTRFPQKPYFSSGFIKKEPSVGGYYPLLRRSIYNTNDKAIHDLSKKYYALQG